MIQLAGIFRYADVAVATGVACGNPIKCVVSWESKT